ncbi:fasciclin domain-containing protein [Oculatella sp. FACHB-28]|uniref:fasciclin domain-containing protein n=1 Tax=Cyanophyceae TaxID=3028117 RepID=UPI001683ACA1|nr:MULTISPECIES: fasciclin domain-containing protein [Cyanophyceae]MBD1870007.1 fasciclin domain-containing protein [Cyanobacteria bacterium FACHB-471]MBD1998871.1 fasciclin domain-containing protein [Leptolyngbya sp. FACHB-541]MBD2058235.1 fasciclin domain-containing protein [Oculatella sp. FACHB-28]MBD2069613.1 fasciclin domain-containing protein [Leptolyngbya sp. FACHB-671]
MIRNQISKRLVLGLVGLSSALVLSACNQPTDTAEVESTEVPATTTEVPATEDPAVEDPTAEGATAGEGETVADLAASDESFSTLATAIEAAGLTETLSGEGPYTVFAPTNEAFEALPEGTLDQLLLPENKDVLAQVLTYHVVPEELPASEIAAGEVETVEGTPVTVEVDEAAGGVMVNNATVIEPDIQASNGVIHAVDQVILPPGAEL